MISDSQQAVLDLLGDVWSRSPDVRLGQLMAHLGFLAEMHHGRSLENLDDDELNAVLLKHRLELTSRVGSSASASLPVTSSQN